MPVCTRCNVFQNRLISKYLSMLKSTPDASSRDPRRGSALEFPTVSRIRPLDNKTNPEIALISEVFPAPFGPIKP